MSNTTIESQQDMSNAFMHHNFIVPEFVDETRAVLRLDIRKECLNPAGFVHGGALCALADNATGLVAHADGRIHVTQSSSLHFLRNQTKGSIYAIAKVRHRGRVTSLYTVDIMGDDDRLLATGESAFYCVEKSLFNR